MEQGGESLVVVDSEYLTAEQILNVYLTNLQEAAETFEKLCEQTTQWAITQSKICVGVNQLRSDMATVRGNLAELSQLLAGQGQAFVQQINDLDQFIY